MRALELDVLCLLGERSRAGNGEGGGNQHRADHEGVGRVTCRLAL
jgi:hypothetical protein